MANGFYREEAQNIPVYKECDILVVGGGAAGQAAALAAARAGAKDIVLMERYGYMGGDVTGGYVIMIPNMSWYNLEYVKGIQEEWLQRIDKIPGALMAPGLDEIGSTDPEKVAKWKGIHDCVSRGTFGGCKPSMLVRSPYYDPQYLKIILDQMINEEKDRITVCYHSWGTKPIMEDGVIKGVIFESKEGRKAILAKVVIDATGDGDIYSQTGTPFQSLADAECRSSTTALVYRVGGIDWEKWTAIQAQDQKFGMMFKRKMAQVAGFRIFPLPTNNNNVCWLNNWHKDMDCTTIKDQTQTEIETRLTILDVIEFMKKEVPECFGGAYLYDIAPQLGYRCSRRLQGEYIMTTNDFAFAKKHDDVIAWHSTICQINDCGPVEIPLGAITPRNVENLLAPGRHLSTDNIAIDWLNLIPQCTGTGQAAGVAAAVAVMDGVKIHDVNVKKVQDILAGEQDVPLPRNEHTPAEYTQLCEEHEYGLYTDAAKEAAEKGESYTQSFRQDTNYKTGENESAKNFSSTEH